MKCSTVCSCDFYVYKPSYYFSFVILYFRFKHSIHIGAPYARMGNIAAAYVIGRTSCISPQLILADYDRA